MESWLNCGHAAFSIPHPVPTPWRVFYTGRSMMKRAKKLPANRAPIKGQHLVLELCNSIEAATRGDITHAGSTIRHAVTQGVKWLTAGAIDSRGAASINGAAARANMAMRARARRVQDRATPKNIADNHRRINLLTSIALPADQFNGVNNEWFD